MPAVYFSGTSILLAAPNPSNVDSLGLPALCWKWRCCHAAISRDWQAGALRCLMRLRSLLPQLDAELTLQLYWSLAQHKRLSPWHHVPLPALSRLALGQVLTLAIFAALTAAMANTIAKHRHYLCMQRPPSGIVKRARWNACFMAERAAQPKTHPSTLAGLLEHADQDGADSMVYPLHCTSRCSIEHNVGPWLHGAIHVHVHHRLLQDASLSCVTKRTEKKRLCPSASI